MSRLEKLGRKYKYRVRQKYQEDPFAFIILWSLFFSAVFLIFAFRGLIATTFMHKIDISNESIQNEVTNETNNTADNTIENTTNNVVDNSANTVLDNQTDNFTNSTANTSE